MSPTDKTSQSVIEKIDQLLEDDKNFTTRSGVRFMTAVLKEALQLIGDAVEKDQSILTRLGRVEDGFNEFLAIRRKEQEKAETERAKWRWAIIVPMIGILLTEIAKLIFK